MTNTVRPKTPPLVAGLSLRGITKEFPGVKALDDVDFDVPFGKVVALVGENGAGKSTLMSVLSGIYRADLGEMYLGGDPYSPTGPHDATQRGVVLVHQELSLLPNLTVAENIFLGRTPTSYGLIDNAALNDGADRLLERVGLPHLVPTTITGRCSVAAQQLVEIAKALSQSPRILVFDEPTASLGQDEVALLYDLVAALRSEGVGVVWITHRLVEVAQVADMVVTLRDGQRVASWEDAGVPMEALITSMVGRRLEHIYPELNSPGSRVLLSVESLTRAEEFYGVSLDVHEGEILGIAGLVGAGRTEFLETVAGARRPDAGRISLDGTPVQLGSPRAAVSRSIVLVPEDRKSQGLAQRLTVEDNVGLPARGFLKGLVSRARLHADVVESAKGVQLRGRLAQLARTLSGGNQQKAVIAKWLSVKAKVFLFDEPTRGIDVGARFMIYEIIQRLARGGAGVIVVSSELPEVMGIAHRIVVLSNGRVSGCLERESFTEQAIMRLAVAGTDADTEAAKASASASGLEN